MRKNMLLCAAAGVVAWSKGTQDQGRALEPWRKFSGCGHGTDTKPAPEGVSAKKPYFMARRKGFEPLTPRFEVLVLYSAPVTAG